MDNQRGWPWHTRIASVRESWVHTIVYSFGRRSQRTTILAVCGLAALPTAAPSSDALIRRQQRSTIRRSQSWTSRGVHDPARSNFDHHHFRANIRRRERLSSCSIRWGALYQAAFAELLRTGWSREESGSTRRNPTRPPRGRSTAFARSPSSITIDVTLIDASRRRRESATSPRISALRGS